MTCEKNRWWEQSVICQQYLVAQLPAFALEIYTTDSLWFMNDSPCKIVGSLCAIEKNTMFRDLFTINTY